MLIFYDHSLFQDLNKFGKLILEKQNWCQYNGTNDFCKHEDRITSWKLRFSYHTDTLCESETESIHKQERDQHHASNIWHYCGSIIKSCDRIKCLSQHNIKICSKLIQISVLVFCAYNTHASKHYSKIFIHHFNSFIGMKIFKLWPFVS